MSDLWDFMSDFVQNFLIGYGIMASVKGTRPAFPENDEEDYVMLKKIAALVGMLIVKEAVWKPAVFENFL